MPIQEFTIKGDGTLRDSQATETAVRYSIRVRKTIVAHPGLPPAVGQADGLGRITAIDGRRFPDGMYWLTTAEGQEIRMQNLGGEWHVLAPV